MCFFGRSIEAANLAVFLKFGKAKTSKMCVIFAKNHGWPRNWGERLEQNWGAVLPGPGLKLLLIISKDVAKPCADMTVFGLPPSPGSYALAYSPTVCP